MASVRDLLPDLGLAARSLVRSPAHARTDLFETVGGTADSMYALTGRGDPAAVLRQE